MGTKGDYVLVYASINAKSNLQFKWHIRIFEQNADLERKNLLRKNR